MTAELRMTQMEVTTVAIPMRGALLHSDGQSPPSQVRHIIELRTDAGITGLGECGPRVEADQLRNAGQAIVGEDPFNLEGVRLRVQSDKFYRMDIASVAAAIQMACLDIQGKVIGRPITDLLGGRQRDRVPGIAYLFRKNGADGEPSVIDATGVVDEASRLVDKYGFGTLKYKAGAVPPEEDIEAVRALREKFPGHRLRVDPNGAWGIVTAIRTGERLRDLGLEWMEDPTLGIEGMAEFNRRVPIPTATNMCCIQPREFPATVASGAVNVMLLDLWYLGGPWSASQMAATCRAFGIGIGIHAGGGSAETGIGVAAEIHLAASLPGLVHAMDSMRHELADDVVRAGDITYNAGALLVPDGPGLGVDLDRDKLDRYAARYRELAATTRPREVSDTYPAYPLF